MTGHDSWRGQGGDPLAFCGFESLGFMPQTPASPFVQEMCGAMIHRSFFRESYCKASSRELYRAYYGLARWKNGESGGNQGPMGNKQGAAGNGTWWELRPCNIFRNTIIFARSGTSQPCETPQCDSSLCGYLPPPPPTEPALMTC